jgi:uncharacterized repeat protein (TIGR01451 family)
MVVSRVWPVRHVTYSVIAALALLMALAAFATPSRVEATGGSGNHCITLQGSTLKEVLRRAGSTVVDGTATLVVPSWLCPAEVSFTSYRLPSGMIRPFSEQVVHDNVTATYGPGRHTIQVDLPANCSWQTDLYTGPVIETLNDTYGHPPTRLIAYDYTQGTACAGPPDVTLVKSASKEEVYAGQSFEYTLVVKNIGNGQAQDVHVKDNTLDPPLVLSVPTVTQGVCAIVGTNNLSCDLGNINAGKSVTIKFMATTSIETCPRARNQAGVSAANEPVENQANNLSEFVNVRVSCEPPDNAALNVKKVDPDGNALAGAVFVVEGIDGTFTTNEDGKFCIVGLTNDSIWKVTEIAAPEGYVIGAEPSQMVEVDDDGDCDSPSATFVNEKKKYGDCRWRFDWSWHSWHKNWFYGWKNYVAKDGHGHYTVWLWRSR